MKYFITFLLLGCFLTSSAQFSSQIAERIAEHDSATIKYYKGASFNYDTRKALNRERDSLYQYFEDSATIGDLKSILNKRQYSGFLYKGLNTLHQRGFSKIELFKRYINNTSKLEYDSYGCMVISAGDYPQITQVGAFMRDRKYTEIERDSFYEILFDTLNKHERLQYLELAKIENNPKYLDLVADFARDKKSYMSIVPLIKFRFEAEEDLIFEVLEKHLFDSKYGGYSFDSNHFLNSFHEIFKIRPNDEATLNLLIKYWKEKPNKAFLKEVIILIAARKNEKALEVLSELYEHLKYSHRKSVRFDYSRIFSFDSFCKLIYENRTPLYHDLYYQIILDQSFKQIDNKYYLSWGIFHDMYKENYYGSIDVYYSNFLFDLFP